VPYSRYGFARRRVKEAAVTGIILLVLIGALVAFGWTRLRGKMKLPITGKSWIGPIFVVALVVLMLFSKSKGH
jgi:fumarate reductase subunit D